MTGAQPGIVAVHEVGRENDILYIVGDYVEGFPLVELLTDRQLSIREAAELFAKMADALDHAHQAGVIHRDLRPHNMDFGLTRREAGDVAMTIKGKVLGTSAYMSPEQAKGEAQMSIVAA